MTNQPSTIHTWTTDTGHHVAAREGSLRAAIIRILLDGSMRRDIAVSTIGCTRSYYMRVRRDTGLRDFDDITDS